MKKTAEPGALLLEYLCGYETKSSIGTKISKVLRNLMDRTKSSIMYVIGGHIEWEVEEILDVKYTIYGAAYLVKWLSAWDNTWEPPGNLVNVPIVLHPSFSLNLLPISHCNGMP